MNKLVATCVGMAFSVGVHATVIHETGFVDSTLTGVNVNTNWGSIAAAPNGDVHYSVGQTHTVFDGVSSSYVANQRQGLEVVGNTLYSGSHSQGGRIYSTDLTTGMTSIVGAIPNSFSINGFALAPAGFGAFAGDLIVASERGVYALDLVTGLLMGSWLSNQYVSDVAFTADDRLLAATGYTNGVMQGIQELTPTGLGASLSNYGLDGLALHESTGDMYSINASTKTIDRVNIDDGTVTRFASGVDASSGWYPSGLAFSTDASTLYYLERNVTGFEVRQINGFKAMSQLQPSANVPAPATLALLVTGLLCMRRTRR